jgi:hypothetical protein
MLGGEPGQGQGLALAEFAEFGVLAGDALGEFAVAGLEPGDPATAAQSRW